MQSRHKGRRTLVGRVGSYTRNRASPREDQPPVSLRNKPLYVNISWLSNAGPRELLRCWKDMGCHVLSRSCASFPCRKIRRLNVSKRRGTRSPFGSSDTFQTMHQLHQLDNHSTIGRDIRARQYSRIARTRYRVRYGTAYRFLPCRLRPAGMTDHFLNECDSRPWRTPLTGKTHGRRPVLKNLLLTFDVFGTLTRPRLPIARQYAEAARRYGIQADVDRVETSFREGQLDRSIPS